MPHFTSTALTSPHLKRAATGIPPTIHPLARRPPLTALENCSSA